jgi:hypothetical protein
MPFTPAHAALVLPPFRSRYFSVTGLTIGSMTPDFEYFIRMSVNGVYGHTFPGLFFFDVPVGLLLAVTFHQIVKKSLISNLPIYFQSRFYCAPGFNFLAYLKKHYLIFFVSVLVGAVSHIFWDNFTHSDGYFVQHLDIYEDTYIPLYGTRYPLFFALQHISTLIGLGAILISIMLLRPRPEYKANKPSVYYWLSVMVITFVVMSARFAFKSSDLNLGNIVVVSISGFCIALIVTGMYTRFNTQSQSIG